ncbi:hypothetical protein ACHAPT_009215 [Fusarium lateritium]
MKTPGKKSAKKKKAKETFKDIETIDLRDSPSPPSSSTRAPTRPSSPSSRPDVYSVPNSLAKRADKEAMPPPASRPNENGESNLPLRTESVRGKTGENTMTRFFEHGDPPTPTPQATNSSRTSQPQRSRDANADWRRAGTGVHDDYLTRARGNFRHKSLRRDSGMIVETPQGIRNERERRIQQGRWPENPTQTTATSQQASASTTREPPRGPRAQNNNPYGLLKPRFQRGDVPPLKELESYQRVAAAGSRVTAPAPARPAVINSNSASIQRSAPDRNPQSAQRPTAVTGSAATATATAPAPATAAVGTTTNETTPGNLAPRRNFSTTCKVEVMELCLASKDMYLNMTPSPNFDQKPFWNNVLQNIESNPITRGKFKGWKDLRDTVDVWAQPRRTSLREGNLPPPSVGQPVLDRVIDKWNHVFAQRFCAVNKGYFESNIWPLAEEHVQSFMQSEIHSWITGALQKRKDELERLTRTPMLGSNRDLGYYENSVRRLFYGSQASSKDAVQVRETEALMSLVLDLQPRLRSTIIEQIRNAGNNGRPGGDGGQGSGDQGAGSLPAAVGNERQDGGRPEERPRDEIVLPSIETRTPAMSARTTGQAHTPGSNPQSGRSQRGQEDGRSVFSSPAGNDGSRRKRKDQGPSPSLGTSGSLAIRNRDALPGYGSTAASTPTRSHSKRRRVDELNDAETTRSLSEFPSPSQLTMSRGVGAASGPPRLSWSKDRSAGRSNNLSQSRNTANPSHHRGREPPFVQTGQSSSPAWARDAHRDPFETPQKQSSRWNGNSQGRSSSQRHGERNAHRQEEQGSPARFREETAEFNSMTQESKMEMLYKTVKEARRKTGATR